MYPISNTGKYIIIYMNDGYSREMINVVNPDGTFDFKEPMTKFRVRTDDDIIECYDTKREVYSINKTTGEIKKVED